MNQNGKTSASGADKDARLKQALKTNLQRRKAQARARAATEGDEAGHEPPEASPARGRKAEQDG